MKAWIIIDDCTRSKAAQYEDVLKVNTEAEAVDIARREWNALSEHDKKLRDAFYIGLADVDEDGCVDFNTMTDIVDIMED